jgi:molecular chaperone HtpG
VGQIKKRLTQKVLDTFQSLLDERREDYEAFWSQFGSVVKEGLWYENERKGDIAKVCLFRTSNGDGWTTLAEYVARAPVGQKAIYTLSAPDLASARRSPHLESFRKKGIEVLLFVDQVDEFALQRLTEFDGKPLRSVSKGELELEGDDDAKKSVEAAAKKHSGLIAAAKEELSDEVSDVRFSARLVDSPAVLVSEEGAFAPHVERMMREAGQAFGPPQTSRVLELNPSHPVVERLAGLVDSDRARFGDYLDLLHGQALLAEGSPLPDPARFARLVTDLMVGAKGG